MHIRQMTDDDIKQVQQVVRSAFYRPGKDTDFNEWTFVDTVRTDKGYMPELCFVAEDNHEIVGYVLLTKSDIDGVPGVALGPLAVTSTHQNKGIGKMLVNHAVEAAEMEGYEWVALTGGAYYNQFGFVSAAPHGIILGENNEENAFLKIKVIKPELLDALHGIHHFAEAFYKEDGELL